MKDLAKAGVYKYPIDAFAPINDKLPVIELYIYDIKKPEEPYIVKVSKKTVSQIWEDFLPYTNKYDEWDRMNQSNKKAKLMDVPKKENPW